MNPNRPSSAWSPDTMAFIERIVSALAVLIALAAIWTGWQLFDQARDAERWQQVRNGAPLTEADGADVQIARALALGADGERADALELYRQIEAQAPDSPQARIARFNSANLHVRDAVDLIADNERGRALPLIEIAKQLYRQLLREDPSDWAVRYNLSRALLLIPDVLDDGPMTSTPESAERASTTMKGYSPGLP